MEFVEREGARIHYELRGEGEPVTMLMGLGASAAWWFPQVPFLSERFQVITIDNRGAGQTEADERPLSMEMFAGDVIAVLDAAGIEQSHLVGLSMGGMIAQHVALRCPERIGKLALCCTHMGGALAVQPAPEVLEALMTMSSDASRSNPRQMLEQMGFVLFPPEYLEPNMGRIAGMIAEAGVRPAEPAAVVRQMGAILGHDTCQRLGEIAHPTLVLTGDKDVLVPQRNAEILAEKIPHARLVTIAGTGHGFNLQAADEFNQTLAEFLAA